MAVYALDFGTTRTGQPTHLYRLKNANGMEVDITDVGASIVSVRVPNKEGKLIDVTLGYDEVSRYENNEFAFGGVVGRCANRIANASFSLGSRTYTLTANEGQNTLHGGRDMWYKRLWEGAIIGREGQRRKGSNADTVIFGLLSSDGDQGFPGELDVRVTYKLTDDNELKVIYDAQPDLPTIVNLTNHAYWNLDGHASGSVLRHTLRISAERYTPAGPHKIPKGTKVNVGGTPFDFRQAKPLGRDFVQGFDDYDHNFMLGGNGHLQHVATLAGSVHGIVMDLYTDLPALQVYTAKKMQVTDAKDGADYGAYAGISLETQFPPDAIHHPSFQQPVFTPDEPFQSRTSYKFSLA